MLLLKKEKTRINKNIYVYKDDENFELGDVQSVFIYSWLIHFKRTKFW